MKHILRSSALILTLIGSLATIAPAQTVGPAKLTNGLITWLQLNETAGTRAQDASGTGKSGQFTSTGYWHELGKIGRCINLTGNQSLRIPLQWQPASFTVAWWVFADGGTVRNFTQAVGANLDDSWQWGSFLFHASASGKIYVGTDIDTRLETTADREANTFTTGKWQHFAFTFQRGEAALYKDGVRIAYRASGMSLPAPWKNLAIGSTVEPMLQAAGYYDDFRVYDRALPAAEVGQLFESVATAYTPPSSPSDDLDRNWSSSRSFDGNGNVIGESKSFTDAMGRPTQGQAKSQTTGHVLATQTVYSSGGKPVLSTLPAPVGNTEFSYKNNFLTAGGQNYSAAHFEGPNINKPVVVDSTTAGSLGYYYSTQNSLEPLTATTSYPFSLTEEYGGPLGGVKRATGPGNQFRMGLGREGKSREFPLLNEMDYYLSLRPQFVTGSPLAATLRQKGEKAVSVGVDGLETISFTDADGRALATCLSGPQYPAMTLTTPINSAADNPESAPVYQDIHIPAAGSTRLTVTGSGAIQIIDLLTEVVTSYRASWPVITLAPGFYRVISTSDSQIISYEAHYGDFSYSYYDDAGRVVATVAPKGLPKENLALNPGFDQNNFFLQHPSAWQTIGDATAVFVESHGGTRSGPYHGSQYKGVDYYAFTHQIVANLPNGQYTFRAWVKSSGGQAKTYLLARNYGGPLRYTSIGATANGTHGEWALVELQGLAVSNGQCDIGFESQASANQFLYFDDVEFFRQPDANVSSFVTRNTFSGAGTLLATESTDEGRTEYVYARDGRIRFSQSALQRQHGRFSYSNYDEVGRVAESGEYTMASSASQGIRFANQAPQAVVYEAENGSTNANSGRDMPPFSGGGYVENLTQQGRYVELMVSVPARGNYMLDERYAAHGNGSMSVYINGNRIQQASFPATGSWSTWQMQTRMVWLEAGTSRVKYQYDAGDAGWINLDYVQVRPTVYEAEQSMTNAVVIQGGVTSGTGAIGYLTEVGRFVTFNVYAPVAGQYTLQQHYATYNAGSMSVYVNGVDVVQAQFPANYAWTNYVDQPITLTLQAGSNTIRYQYDATDAGQLNLDYLQLTDTRSPAANNVLALLEERMPTNSLDVARCSQRNQVWYDLPLQDTQLSGRTQEFVLGGVAKASNGTNTTWYSYDELGRVTWMVQQVPGVGVKTVDYAYDFSGNVLEVAYQKGQPDAFYHHYSYDADRRLRTVHTSPDGIATNQTLHARYSYYLHGPLKRVEIAGQLQGIDYAYTVQGWLKSINNAEKALDPGQDSPTGNGVLKDLFGMRLDYFNGDYQSRQLTAPALNSPANQNETRYGGSVRANTWHTAAAPAVHGYAYQYDAKGQLLQSDYGQLTGGNFLSHEATRKFEEGNLSYDAHGNILTLRRRDGAGMATDDFAYQYTTNTNKLEAVKNQAGANVLSYEYDVNGQMTREMESGKGDKYLRYDVTGKVTGVYRNADFTSPLATYAYDDRGFRSSKIVYNTSGVAQNTTYYVTDAQGNALSTYEQAAGQDLQQTEIPLYGSGRVGTLTRLEDGTLDARYELNDQLGNARVVFHKPTTTKYLATMEPSQASREEDEFENIATTRAGGPMWDGSHSALLRTISGIKEGPKKSLTVQKGDTITFTAMVLFRSWNQEENTASRITPYLAAGGIIAGSNVLPAEQRETGLSRSAKWLGPLSRLSAGIAIPFLGHATSSPSRTASGPAIYLRYRLFDPASNALLQEGTINVSGGADIWEELKLGLRLSEPGRLELTTVTNAFGTDAHFDAITIEHTTSTIVQEQHTYAFGSPLTGLNYTVGNKRYRHGYQGKYAEIDEETGYDSFELRLYNSRIGRWTAPDPAEQFNSPYVGMGNNPVSGIDPDGGEVLPGVTIVGHLSTGQKALNFALKAARNYGSYGLGVGRGVLAGVKDTGRFAAGLTPWGSQHSWQEMGQGIKTMAVLTGPLSAEQIMLQNQIGQSIEISIGEIPNMSAEDVGYAVGYAGEKVAEGVLLDNLGNINKLALQKTGNILADYKYVPGPNMPANTVSIKNAAGTAGMRYDLRGASHFSKKLNITVPTPHKLPFKLNVGPKMSNFTPAAQAPSAMGWRDMHKVFKHLKSGGSRRW